MAAAQERKYQKSYFDVLGICCSSEVPLIENILKSLEGVKEVSVIVPSRTVIVLHDALLISQHQIGKKKLITPHHLFLLFCFPLTNLTCFKRNKIVMAWCHDINAFAKLPSLPPLPTKKKFPFFKVSICGTSSCKLMCRCGH